MNRKFVLDVKEKVNKMSIDELKEFLIELLEKRTAYTINDNVNLRLFGLIKDLMPYGKQFKCNVCENWFNLSEVLNGQILDFFKVKFICSECLNDIESVRA